MVKLDKIFFDEKLTQVINNILPRVSHSKLNIKIDQPAPDERRNPDRLIMLGDETSLLNVLTNVVEKCIFAASGNQVDIRLQTPNDWIVFSINYNGEKISENSLESYGQTFPESTTTDRKEAFSMTNTLYRLCGKMETQNDANGNSLIQIAFPNQKLLCFAFYDNYD